MTAIFAPSLSLRYEIYPGGGGWLWRCVAATGEILDRARQPMSQEGCQTVVASLRSTLAAPVICMAE
jgi:hypothetical protein